MTVAYNASGVPRTFSATAVSAVIRDLLDNGSAKATRTNWLRAVASLVVDQRRDLADDLEVLLGVAPFATNRNPLKGLTIGEVGVCYEALTALSDAGARKAAGQYFTPDDAARFMAQQSVHFPEGVWMDPCCGVGNLAWHLASVQSKPGEFVRDRLVLVDIDETALLSAVALIAADFLVAGDVEGLHALHGRAVRRNFLARTRLPECDYVIVNPPYARTLILPHLQTHTTRELFAYFLERVTKTFKGFISVTPASYLSAPKFTVLRELLNECNAGGQVFVFDNVPDTLFRGYKFGSSNTSNTNFVRAAVTVCSPSMNSWEITPIIRWRSISRSRVFSLATRLLAPRLIGPAGEWVKLAPGLEGVWKRMSDASTAIKDLTVKYETPHVLSVGLTPRYYISAAFRDLDRGSKATLYFKSEADRRLAATVLNSSIPYIWWRGLDGGVTLPRRVLMGTPIPTFIDPIAAEDLARKLQETEEESITTKLNAGKVNENVKRDREMVDNLNSAIFGVMPDLTMLYTEDMPAEN